MGKGKRLGNVISPGRGTATAIMNSHTARKACTGSGQECVHQQSDEDEVQGAPAFTGELFATGSSEALPSFVWLLTDSPPDSYGQLQSNGHRNGTG